MTPVAGPPPPKIGIGSGWRWFTGALGIVRRWPTQLLLMGLMVAVIGSIFPFVSRLALLIMGPAFLAGIAVAAHTAVEGGKPTFGQLFAMFREPAQRNEALKLCIPLVVANLVAALVLAIGVTHLLANQGVDLVALEGHPQKMVALMRKVLVSDAMRSWWFAAAGILAVAWTFIALAIPRVALSHAPAFRAMGVSLRLVWGHLGAWIVAAVALLAGLAVLALLLQLTRIALIMQLGVFTALYAVLGPMLYLAWRDLGGLPAARDAKAPPAPPRPPIPPPPSGILEA